ncbi:hypothetical protein BDZ85DRAFT_280485 [Elsinoe ampelina]|uniref:Phosphatidic acid phosphatase type 2/haloperoxidase domain-containing protein n=1 Tax=Elsinoe ampelina TaxID=302913 RepID=A0A6A6GI42_9PEZI|nr:hypothetical protein BDZ85DRAFT_280485 [Elsinoe ampelina]
MARFTLVSPNSVKESIRNELTFQRTRRDAAPSIDSRPTFLEWLRIVWPDILTMIVIGAIALGFDKMWPPYHRLFPYVDASGTLLAPELAYPKIRPSLSAAASGILSVGTPIVIFVLSQFFIRHFWSLNNAVLGLLYANIGGSCFQVMIKTLIGGFRPHFLSVCQPDFSRPGANQGIQGVYHDWSICTGESKDIKNAIISFPSGHTEAAFASFVYLSIWLNANLKVMGSYQPRYWKMVAVFAPLMAAILIAGDLQMSYNHHWYDILMGAVIGISFALVAYRSQFAAVLDSSKNDLVLFRKSTVDKATAGGKVKGRGSTDSGDLV